MRRYLVEYLYWFKIKKIDKEAKTDNINKTVFWIIICYDIFYFSQTSTAAYALMMLSILLPLAIITLSVSKHPAKLTQLEYLCPLSYEERKTKIKNAYLFRVCIHLVIAAISLGILTIVYKANWFIFILLLINDIMMSIAIYPGKDTKSTEYKMGYILYYAVMIMAFMANAFIVAFGMETELGITTKCIISIMFCIIFVPVYLSYLKHIKKELTRAIDFEQVKE